MNKGNLGQIGIGYQDSCTGNKIGFGNVYLFAKSLVGRGVHETTQITFKPTKTDRKNGVTKPHAHTNTHTHTHTHIYIYIYNFMLNIYYTNYAFQFD